MSGPVSDRILGYQPWIHEDPALIDLSARWRVMDAFDDYVQVLTLAVPPPAELGDPAMARDLARAANDQLARLVPDHPDRVAGRIPPPPPTTSLPGWSATPRTGSPGSAPRCR